MYVRNNMSIAWSGYMLGFVLPILLGHGRLVPSFCCSHDRARAECSSCIKYKWCLKVMRFVESS
jgi:hypothetical protein